MENGLKRGFDAYNNIFWYLNVFQQFYWYGINIRETDMFTWLCLFLKAFLYLFIFRELGREGEREGEKHQCVRETSINCLSHAPNQGPGALPRYVPWRGFKLATLMPNLLSHTSQGILFNFNLIFPLRLTFNIILHWF